MTNYEIEAFLAVCRQKSFSRAAETLYISQSSLSTRLKTLEKELGCELFLRQKGGRAVSLTEAGQKFYDLSLQYQDILQQMYAVAGNQKQERLRISSLNSIGTYLFPTVYETFIRCYPEISLEVQDMETEMACMKIEAGQTDLAFTSERHESGQIASFPIFSEPMAFICSADSAYSDEVQLSRLSVKHEVYIDWSVEYSRWHGSVFGADFIPKIRLEIMGQLQFFVEKKDCWSIVPASVANGLAANMAIRQCRMAFPVPEREVYLLCCREVKERESSRRFLECLREELIGRCGIWLYEESSNTLFGGRAACQGIE